MKKLLGMLIVALLASAIPDAAAAQCGSMCMRLVKETGEVGGHGCAAALNDDACVATVARCTVSRCANALLTTPEGRVVGQLACTAGEAESGRIASAAFGLPALFFAHAARQMEAAAGDRTRLPTGAV